MNKTKKSLFILLALCAFFMIGCKGLQATHRHHKGGFSFSMYEDWQVSEDRYGIDIRHITVQSTGVTKVKIEIHTKSSLADTPAHQQYATSLQAFADYYNKVDIRYYGRTPQPVTQTAIQRREVDGLKQTQKFIVDTPPVPINRDSIHEFYRFNTQDLLIFIALNTSGEEYAQSEAGIELILSSLRYE